MHKSVDHIMITHTGSLPRGQELNDLLIADEAGESVDQRKLTDMVDKRVAYVMQKQREAGVDVANDGEQGRVGFQTYIPKRMSGFGGESKRPFGREWVELPARTVFKIGLIVSPYAVEGRRGDHAAPGKRVAPLSRGKRAYGRKMRPDFSNIPFNLALKK